MRHTSIWSRPLRSMRCSHCLAESPGEFLPIAGGTESMVAFGAGRLQAKKLVSLWGLKELRFISATR